MSDTPNPDPTITTYTAAVEVEDIVRVIDLATASRVASVAANAAADALNAAQAEYERAGSEAMAATRALYQAVVALGGGRAEFRW